MALEWRAVLADHLGENLAELPGNFDTERFLDRPGGPHTLELSHEDALAGLVIDALRNGLPRFYGYRRESGAWVLRAAGQWRPMDDEASGDKSTRSLAFQGAMSQLAGRLTGRDGAGMTGELVEYLGEQIGAVAQAIVETADTDDDLGIQIGTVEATTVRDVLTYEWKDALAALDDLSTGDGSIDWLDDPIRDGADFGELNVYDDVGTEQPGALLGHGPDTIDNCTSARQSWRLPRNHVVVIGDEGVYQQWEDTTSISRYGRWTHVETVSDVIEADILLDRAQKLIRPNPVRVVTMTPDPADAPTPGIDYDAGDTIPYHIDRGHFQAAGEARLSGYKITVEDGIEAQHEIEFETDEEV